jgi:hypothetical protein
VTWTSRTSGTTNTLYGVAGHGAQNVVVGAGGTILTSPAGVVWTPGTPNGGNVFRSVVWSGTQFLIGGDWSGISNVQTSYDGLAWTAHPSIVGNVVNGTAWSGTRFATVGAFGTTQTSPDGISWTDGGTTGVDLHGVAWFKNQFITVGMFGDIYLLQ